jgi:hypothetical protein
MRIVGRDAGPTRRPVTGLPGSKLEALKAICTKIGAEEARL